MYTDSVNTRTGKWANEYGKW